MKHYTLVDSQKDFPDDDMCLDAIFKARYGNLKFCPHCGAETKFYRLRKKKAYCCMQQHCGFTLSPTANMIFDHSPTPLTKWFYALYLFSVSKNGVSAMELQRHLGVTYKTAWRMCKQIRLLMRQSGSPLSGIVEIDETYIGGKHKRKGHSTTRPLSSVWLKRRKAPAKLRLSLPSEPMPVSLAFIRAMAKQGTEIQTDESRIYHRVKREYAHRFVNHSKEEYSKNGVSTKPIGPSLLELASLKRVR